MLRNFWRMFRHHDSSSQPVAEDANLSSQMHKNASAPAADISKPITPKVQQTIEELLEKNLKWSQIIYEQNRKIQHKLLWLAIGSWVRVLVIAVPLVLGTLYLAPFVRNYYCLFSGQNCPTSVSHSSWDSIIQTLPLTAEQKAQLKNSLK